jgi:hypothetical protein
MLTKAYFPILLTLNLAGNNIGLQGFLKILDINAPRLMFIHLSRTLLTENDLLYIAEFADLNKFPQLQMVETGI